MCGPGTCRRARDLGKLGPWVRLLEHQVGGCHHRSLREGTSPPGQVSQFTNVNRQPSWVSATFSKSPVGPGLTGQLC